MDSEDEGEEKFEIKEDRISQVYTVSSFFRSTQKNNYLTL